MAQIKAIVYSRVSTDMQDIESQRVTVRRYIESNSIEVVRDFSDEARQGDDESRPAYNELLKHLNDPDFDDGKWGAKPKIINLSRYDTYKSMGLSDRQAAKLLGCSRNTLAKRLCERQRQEQEQESVPAI